MLRYVRRQSYLVGILPGHMETVLGLRWQTTHKEFPRIVQSISDGCRRQEWMTPTDTSQTPSVLSAFCFINNQHNGED